MMLIRRLLSHILLLDFTEHVASCVSPPLRSMSMHKDTLSYPVSISKIRREPVLGALTRQVPWTDAIDQYSMSIDGVVVLKMLAEKVTSSFVDCFALLALRVVLEFMV